MGEGGGLAKKGVGGTLNGSGAALFYFSFFLEYK